jgi:hypothetical protein
MDETQLLEKLLFADKLDQVRELIDEFVQLNASWIVWRPVGDRKNNSGTIQAAGDPARSLLERVTNGIDAVIERAHQDHHGRPECRSPREAAQAWFGVPPSGLHKLTDAGRRKLAQGAVTVALTPGDGKAKRTVMIADKGLGLTAEQMPRTILSLNAENKIDKFYLSGAFGQGGSATFANSDYTLIASRSVKDAAVIAFTVVKLEPPLGIKLGTYVYLTVSGTLPTTKQIPDAFGDFSTIVKHFGYDLDDYPSPLGPNSIYGRAQAILFEPILPFWFENEVHGYSRTIKGSRTALNGARDEGEEESKLTWSNPLFFANLGEHGSIGIEYWVLEPKEKSAPNKAFVTGSKPIVLTINGQTHAEWGASILRKDAELLHLASRMVVHLDCNQLSFDAKRVLFVSNREESRKGQVQNMILGELLGALKSDEKLAELEDQARLAGTKERDEKDEQEVRKEVAKMLRLFGFSASEDSGAKKAAGGHDKATAGGSRKAKPRAEPIQVNEPPSFVELVGGDPVEFFPGQRRYLRIRTDAHSKYHDAADLSKSRFSFLVDGDAVNPSGSSELRDGHMRVVFAAKEDAAVDASGRISIELRPPNRPTLSSSLNYVIVETPPAKQGSSKVDLPNIDCQPVESKDSQEWISLDWPEDPSEIAADYVYGGAKDTLVIRYSTIFPRYRSVRDQLVAKDVARGASFVKRFEIWLITSVLIHWQDTLADPTKLTDTDLEEEAITNFRRDELRRMSKAAVIYAQRESAALGLASITDADG